MKPGQFQQELVKLGASDENQQQMNNCGSSTRPRSLEEDRADKELRLEKVWPSAVSLCCVPVVLGKDPPAQADNRDVSSCLVLQDRLDLLRREEEQLLRELRSIRAALSEEDVLQDRLKQQTHVSPPQLRPHRPPSAESALLPGLVVSP